VPCFDWICEHRAWFDVFYEHVNYFRLEDFARLFGTVHASGHLFGGQYLYVVADLATLRPPVSSAGAFAFPEDFLATVQLHAARLAKRATPAAVWGGASKGVLFSLFMQNAGAAVDMVVDINPAKHGKYLPATGLRVRSPDEAMRLLAPGADVFVMNGRYADEIRKLTGDRFNYVTVDHATI
jgi:threonine dehydrogenase-like Zn-dependent dehydrogenase